MTTLWVLCWFVCGMVCQWNSHFRSVPKRRQQKINYLFEVREKSRNKQKWRVHFELSGLINGYSESCSCQDSCWTKKTKKILCLTQRHTEIILVRRMLQIFLMATSLFLDTTYTFILNIRKQLAIWNGASTKQPSAVTLNDNKKREKKKKKSELNQTKKTNMKKERSSNL